MPNIFPTQSLDKKVYVNNLAIQLFGNRFYTGQSTLEFLNEFLLVATSPKSFKTDDMDLIETIFPDINELRNNKIQTIKYSPKARLNLKLFAFLSISKISSRHASHLENYKDIIERTKEKIIISGEVKKDTILKALENLFIGFQGVGSGRTWCAQQFIPICTSFLTNETIWKESEGKRKPNLTWQDINESSTNFNQYFSTNSHNFLSGGGELLYLQICNALRQEPQKILDWFDSANIPLSEEERNPERLLKGLTEQLRELFNDTPKAINQIAQLIDEANNTIQHSDQINNRERTVEVGWCNTDSWREGYLFAIDIYRICKSKSYSNIIDKLQTLETACVLHVIRSLGMKSARVSENKTKNSLGYYLAISDSEEKNFTIKKTSNTTVKNFEKLIYNAIRSESLNLDAIKKENLNKEYSNFDKKYGGKLFLRLGKLLGFIIPKRGAHERFVLNEQILKFLVTTTVPLGGYLTYDTFIEILEMKYGFVFDSNGLQRAAKWTNFGKSIFYPPNSDQWFQNMLKKAGLLIPLSDFCSMVTNPDLSKGTEK